MGRWKDSKSIRWLSFFARPLHDMCELMMLHACTRVHEARLVYQTLFRRRRRSRRIFRGDDAMLLCAYGTATTLAQPLTSFRRLSDLATLLYILMDRLL